jgi:hypothetical protein
LNEKKKTVWRDQEHIQNAFKGWMKNVKADPADLETNYYPIIKSKIEAISSQVEGLRLDNRWMRHQLTMWAKETLDVVKTDQQAVLSYTAYVVKKMKYIDKDVSEFGNTYGEMESLTKDIFHINEPRLISVLAKIRKNAICESDGIPPMFPLQEKTDGMLEKVKEVIQKTYTEEDFEEKWVEFSEIIKNSKSYVSSLW